MMRTFWILALLGFALSGCLATGDMVKNIAVSTEPSPLYLNVENSLPVGVVSVANNNPFEVSVQCFPPAGPSEGYFQEDDTGVVNKTLFTRPEVRCYDSDELGNLSKAVYPTVTIKPHESHAFVLEASSYGSVRTGSNQTFSTAPGLYALDMRLDVRCHEVGCTADAKSIEVPMQVNIPQVEQ